MRRTVIGMSLVGLLVAVLPLGVKAQDAEGPFPADTVAVGLDESAMPNVTVSVELSRVTFADGGADVVLIGRDDLFADSLASGVAQDAGPLLLVPTGGPVPQVVLDEIGRLDASRAVIFGGENAVSPAVADQLSGAGLAVERREGASRIETAVAVARADAVSASTAILARAGGVEGNPTSGFADALAAGGWSAAMGWPVLLTQTEVLTGSTRDYIAEAGISQVMVMGGTAAVSDAVMGELQSMGVSVERVAGPDRAATAVETAKARGADSAAGVDRVIVVDGFGEDAWAAGFAAAALSARGATRQAGGEAPIVLANVESLPPATQEWLVPGPAAMVCAVTAEVCDQARGEVGFDPAIPTDDLPAGSVLFTIAGDATSRVMAVDADGSNLRLAHACDDASCAELDWDPTSSTVVLQTARGPGQHQFKVLTGVPLAVAGTFGFAVIRSFDMSNLAGDEVFMEHVGEGRDISRGQLVSGGSAQYATPVQSRAASFQSINAMADLPHSPGWGTPHLHAGQDENLYIDYVPEEGGNPTSVPAHATRRPGAAIIGAALAVDGSGDIALTDEIGGQGVLRYATADGDTITADGLDVSSTPYLLPDARTIVVLAQVDGSTALVAVDSTTGDHEVLVADAGAGEDDRRISADGSGTFISWTTGSDIRVLDTRDGTVAVVDAADGFVVTGGPAVKQ